MQTSPEIIWRALYPELLLKTDRAPEALAQITLLFSEIEKQSQEYADRQHNVARNRTKAGDTEAVKHMELHLSDVQRRVREYAYPIQVQARILATLGRYEEARAAEHAAATRSNTTAPLDTLIPRVP
ncbi:MAG TPA: hypothetical protein VF808_06955 [Ktedonobacterales bacterium]